MCNRYPNCQHAGPLHDEIAGIPRHCETVLPNHNCYYLRLGCRGCTFAHMPNPPAIGSTMGQLLLRLVLVGDVSQEWANKTAENVIQYRLRQTICRLIGARIEQRIKAEMFEEILKAFGLPESFFNDDQGV